MELPLISVVIPVYKVEQYLDRCLQSVTGQTYENLEILLVDDGSPDGSGAICDAWAEKDPRIRVIHQNNSGAGAARNAALDIAKGEIIAFVDSDDYLHPNMYACLYSLMEGEVDIAECGIVLTEEEDFPLDDGTRGVTEVYDLEDAMRLHIRDEKFCQTPPNKLYRRNVVGEHRFPVGKLIDDEYFTYLLIGGARKLACSSCRMYAYRQQPGSAMHKPYSLRRLDGIPAKRQRLRYIQEYLPQLSYEAAHDLYMTCLLAMQGCLRYLEGEEQKKAKAILFEAIGDVQPFPIDPSLPKKRKGLLWLSKVSFTGTARLLNFLIDIHVLT